MNEAAIAPPGVTLIHIPTTEERIREAQVRSTTARSMAARLPLKCRPSSMVRRISDTPNRPITTTRKSKPFISSVEPKVRRRSPEIVSRPTAARRKPSAREATILALFSRPMPMKEQKVRKKTPKNSAGPKRRANLATRGATKVIRITPERAPMKDAVKAAVSASPARPCCAIG